MNVPTYNLFRARIDDNRSVHPGAKPEDTHLISIDCMINGDRWSSNVHPIESHQLKSKVEFLKLEIIKGANHHNKRIIVTSIG